VAERFPPKHLNGARRYARACWRARHPHSDSGHKPWRLKTPDTRGVVAAKNACDPADAWATWRFPSVGRADPGRLWRAVQSHPRRPRCTSPRAAWCGVLAAIALARPRAPPRRRRVVIPVAVPRRQRRRGSPLGSSCQGSGGGPRARRSQAPAPRSARESQGISTRCWDL
jgi:hypothetical protein